MKELVLVLDLGTGVNHMVARCVRDCNVYCNVLGIGTDIKVLKELSPIGILLTGGDDSAFRANAPNIEKIKGLGVPVLECIQNEASSQKETIKDFLFNKCKAKGGWTMKNFAAEYIQTIKEKIGDKRVLCGLSGGVDSSVCAALLSKAIGKNLVCIFVDHGLMRKNEGDEIEAVFQNFDFTFHRVDASERFLQKLKGVVEPEKKRKIIGEEFIRVFEDEAKKFGKIDYLMQGTIYPDVIESGIGKNKPVKSHHNVGGLPEKIGFSEIIEPLYWLFKDEVRELGRELGLPKQLSERQPFPGPGLGVRVLGELTREKLDILREADAIFREEIVLAGLDQKLKQYFAVLTGLKSVGVKDGKRTYDYTIALRAIITTDFMQAECAELPFELLKKVSMRIANEVEGACRVVYDLSAKPPATIEWE